MSLSVVESVATNDLEVYLNTLYGEIEGWVYAPTLDRATDKFTRYFYKWPHHRLELIAHIKKSTQTFDTYIAPSLFKSDEAAVKENVQGSHVVWCEFDGSTPDLEPGTGIPEPTLRIQSSEKGWEHWYWSLNDFQTDITQIEQINRGLTYKLGADSSGWDANQILRPPTTLNHKRNQMPVGILYRTPLSYPISSFAGLPEPTVQLTEFNASDAYDALDVVAKYAWTKKAWTFFRTRPPVGERSTALMQLGYICAEMGMDDREIFSVLFNADDRWDKFKGRLDRDRRLCDIIVKARIKHPLQTSNLQTLQVYGTRDLLNSKVEIKWTIPDLLQQSGSLLLSGPPGLGKTQLSLRFSMAMVLGHGYLNYSPPLDEQKLIYFSLEMPHAGLKYFLSQMVTQMSPQELDLLQTKLLLVPLGESLYLDQEQQQHLLESVVEKYEPTGIIIDSLGSTSPDELSNESTAKAIFDWEQRFRNKFGTFVWWIHHNRKANVLNKTPNKLDDVYGNRYVQARPDSIISAWGQPGADTFQFITLKQRFAETRKPFTVVRNGLDFTAQDAMEFTNLIESEPEVDYKTVPKGLSSGI